MNLQAYESVSLVPIVVPAECLPTERPDGTDTFRIHVPTNKQALRKGERRRDPSTNDMLPTEAPVIMLTREDLLGTSPRGKRIWGKMGPKFKKKLAVWIQFRKALQGSTTVAEFAELYREIMLQTINDGVDALSMKSAFDTVVKQKRALACLVSQGLQSARLVLWYTQSRFMFAIWCDSLESAVRVWALPMIFGKEWFAVCRHPRCKGLFMQLLPGQEYCCPKHRERQRLVRWRKKQRRSRTLRGRGQQNRPAKIAKPGSNGG